MSVINYRIISVALGVC